MMGMTGYRPPFTKMPANPYANSPPVDPFGMDAGGIAPMMQPIPDMKTQDVKPSFFGQGSAGRGIAGSIGDYLLQMNGMRPVYAPAMAEQSAFERGEQQYQRTRRDGMEDWQAKERFKATQGPDGDFADTLRASGVQPGTPEWQQSYKTRMQNMLAPPMMPVQGFDASGNPTITMMPRTGGAQPPPQAPVGKLKPYGGQTSPASGGFQPPRLGR